MARENTTNYYLLKTGIFVIVALILKGKWVVIFVKKAKFTGVIVFAVLGLFPSIFYDSMIRTQHLSISCK